MKYERKIDNKGRIILPGESSVIYVIEQSPKTDERPYNCITVYPKNMIPEIQLFDDFWSSRRHETTLDSQKRVVLSPKDLSYIGLDRTQLSLRATLIDLERDGFVYFRIWNPEDFQSYSQKREAKRSRPLGCSIPRPRRLEITERIA